MAIGFRFRAITRASDGKIQNATPQAAPKQAVSRKAFESTSSKHVSPEKVAHKPQQARSENGFTYKAPIEPD